MSALVEVRRFTDPACPFAFSAEPVRWRLRWQYGEQLAWRTTMIVLTREPGEAETLASGADGLQRRYGMPIARGPRERPASSEPACRAFVAARLHAPGRAEALLRRLQIRTMAGGLLDDPALLAGAARDVGLDPYDLAAWSATDAVGDALEADAAAARSPSSRARALDHRLGGPREERRYSAPSVELRRADGAGEAVATRGSGVEATGETDVIRGSAVGATGAADVIRGSAVGATGAGEPAGEAAASRGPAVGAAVRAAGAVAGPIAATVPGFNPTETYETALANLEPRLERRSAPDSVEALLAWAGEPLATAEVALVMGLDARSAQEALEGVAAREAVGPDAYWSLA